MGGSVQEIELEEVHEKKNDEDDEEKEVMHDPEEQQLTLRSLLVGSLTGGLVTCANTYMGFKTGWSFGASIFCALIGFSVLKTCSVRFPNYFSPFGPKENCALQTAGSAAGGLFSGFVTAIPALAWFGVTYPFHTLLLWTTMSAYFGLFFAIPLRRYAIIVQKLKFPSGTATAHTISTMHESLSGEEDGKKRTKVLLVSFALSFAWSLFSLIVPMFYDVPLFYWIGLTGASFFTEADKWNWCLNFSPAFWGAGMLMGMNPALSFCTGTFLAWGVIGPLLLHFGVVKTYHGFSDPEKNPSAQFWLLWMGVSIMIFSSFADLLFNWKIFWNAISGIVIKKPYQFHPLAEGVENERKKEEINDEQDEDPAKPEERIPTLWWSSGVAITSICTVIVVALLFHIPWYEVVLALILGFLFSFIGVQSAGETDINPIGVIGKVTQFVFAIISGDVVTNLMAANIAASAAAQSVDMLTDLKTGHILKASPRVQFIAQMVGSVVAILFSVMSFEIFTRAFPCILAKPSGDENAKKCQFPLPAAAAWYGVALVLQKDFASALPRGASWGMLIGCVIGTALVVAKYFLKKELRPYVPSASAFGIAFVNSQASLGPAMLFGALIFYFWERKSNQNSAASLSQPEITVPNRNNSFTTYGLALASGLVAGEGIAGATHSLLMISGLPLEYCLGLPPSRC